MAASEIEGPVAFVLGGGGVRGAVEVGMLQALLEAGIVPDLVVGTSIGAINGAVVAADPSQRAIEILTEAWASPTANAVYGDSWTRQLRRLAVTRTHLHSAEPLRRLLEGALGGETTFADLAVPLRVVAASIERAAEHWFDSGPVVDAVMASASVPGLLPPTRIGEEHFIDGGIVNSIPVEAALMRGAATVFVLQVGRVEEPLEVPRNAVETARVAFEVARRHRYTRDLARLPDTIGVHLMPTGLTPEDASAASYRKTAGTPRRIRQAHRASAAYLERLAGT